jgi:hypothetical protein
MHEDDDEGTTNKETIMLQITLLLFWVGGIKKKTARRLPTWSPTVVLAPLKVAYLQRSDESWCDQHDMAVSDDRDSNRIPDLRYYCMILL